MKAHISDKDNAMLELEALWTAKLKQASLNGFMMGGHAAMKAAANKYSDRIHEAVDFDTLKTVVMELLKYLTDKADGLKAIAEGEKGDPRVETIVTDETHH